MPVVLHTEDYILWMIQSYSLSYPADFTEFKHGGLEGGGGVYLKFRQKEIILHQEEPIYLAFLWYWK
jgi:hypothetical protein